MRVVVFIGASLPGLASSDMAMGQAGYSAVSHAAWALVGTTSATLTEGRRGDDASIVHAHGTCSERAPTGLA